MSRYSRTLLSLPRRREPSCERSSFWVPAFAGMIGVGLFSSACLSESSSSNFDPISRHIYHMDIQQVDLQREFFPNRQERNTVLAKLQTSGYSNIGCQDNNFDECLVQYYESDAKTYEFNVMLDFENNDLTTAIGRFTWTRNAKNK